VPATLGEVVLAEIGDGQKARIGGLVQVNPRVKFATKTRQGRNPATGEAITIVAKPASVDLRARPLARAKGALPSVQKGWRGTLGLERPHLALGPAPAGRQVNAVLSSDSRLGRSLRPRGGELPGVEFN
jgi:hypothetical protein